MQDIEKKYEIDLEKLNRKLKWYAENQDLLDKDSEQLKKKDAEIKELRDKVEFLQTEVHHIVSSSVKARMYHIYIQNNVVQQAHKLKASCMLFFYGIIFNSTAGDKQRPKLE